MSLLTRCPACTTLYRVVPDQLRISQGWVKCGQCGEIFDASQHLIEAFTETEAVSSDVHEPALDVPAADVLADERIDPSIEEPMQMPTASELDAVLDPGLSLDHEPLTDLVMDAGLNSREGASSVAVETLTETSAERVEIPDWQALRPSMENESTLDTDTDTDLDQLSFLNPARGPSFWQRPLVRVVLLLLCVLLGLGLLAQWVYQERDRLAAMRPDLKPTLEIFCRPLNCSVRALQRIDALVVDTASFNKIQTDVYRLSFTVKNLSGLALALPSVEVTLTDLQDQVVLRRVLSPQDLSVAADILAAGTEWPVSAAVRVVSDAATPRVVGYRVMAFYP